MSNTHQRIAKAFYVASLFAAPCAHAGLLDTLFSGKAEDVSSEYSKRRTMWNIHDFSSIQLVPRESGAPDNRQPTVIDASTLQRLLESVGISGVKEAQPLMTSYEAEQLSTPLSEALASATPGQDVLMVSSERRIKNSIEPPMAITARIFVNADGLQLVIRDVRFNFYDKWRGTGVTPDFQYGSRAIDGSAQVQSALGTNHRSGWLAFPLASGITSAKVPAVVKTIARTPDTRPAPGRRDADFYDAQELRLQSLRRLREKELITDQEYLQKRQEILNDM